MCLDHLCNILLNILDVSANSSTKECRNCMTMALQTKLANKMAQLPKKKNKDEENNLDVNTGNGGPGQSSPLPKGQPVPY